MRGPFWSCGAALGACPERRRGSRLRSWCSVADLGGTESQSGEESFVAFADLAAGLHRVLGVGHIHGRAHAESREQVSQRLNGLGLEHPLGHGVAEVADDLTGGTVAAFGE